MPNPPGVAGLAIACVAALVAATLAQTPAAPPVTVVGHVVDALSGAPIAGAVVNLNTAAQPSIERAIATGADGRFVFDNVAPGKYYVFASKPGFFTAGLNDDFQHGASDELVIGWPAPPFLTLKLRPHGSVHGTVVDDAGKPVAGAKVTALARQLAWQSWGKRMIWMPALGVQAPVTDAQGRYTIDAMDPGEYLIEIDAPNVAIAGKIPMTFGTAYAPGVRLIARASSIVLGVGEHGSADIRVEPLAVFDVSGIVVAPTTDSASVFVQLRSVVETEERQRPAIEQFVTNGQSFTFARVPPGEYLIAARVNSRFWAEQRVRIDDRDLTDVRVLLAPPFLVTGRVIWEGEDRPPPRTGLRRPAGPVHFDFAPSPEEMAYFAKLRAESPIGLANMVSVRSGSRGDWGGAAGPTWAADGTFTMALVPGRFIAEDARLNGWFLKSFRINGRDAIDEPVEIDANSTGAVLTLTRTVGEVRGTIVTASGAADRASMAILFSTNARVWPGIFATRGPHLLMTGGDGTDQFVFPDVLPGEYYLAAIVPMPWDRVDEDMLRRLAVSAVRVQVIAGAPMVRTLTRPR